MASSLLAFRLAKPIEFSDDVHIAVCNPVTQTSTWDGGGPILAVGCTSSLAGGRCYAYGSYCNDRRTSQRNNKGCD